MGSGDGWGPGEWWGKMETTVLEQQEKELKNNIEELFYYLIKAL